MMRFATVGDNCIDRYLPPIGAHLVGGNAVNVAVQLAALGRAVDYFGAVGDDPPGQAVRKALTSRGVGAAHLLTLPGLSTAYTEVASDADGERRFLHEDFGACARYVPGESDLRALRAMAHVHIGWLNDGGAVKRALRGCGPAVSQDLSVNAPAESLSPGGLDIAFCAAAASDGERQVQRLLQAGARLAVVTLGAAGSLACNGEVLARAGPPAVAPLDTTGAGDAFIAGFIDAHAAGRDLHTCLSQATSRAGFACLHPGGFPQEPIS